MRGSPHQQVPLIHEPTSQNDNYHQRLLHPPLTFVHCLSSLNQIPPENFLYIPIATKNYPKISHSFLLSPLTTRIISQTKLLQTRAQVSRTFLLNFLRGKKNSKLGGKIIIISFPGQKVYYCYL